MSEPLSPPPRYDSVYFMALTRHSGEPDNWDNLRAYVQDLERQLAEKNAALGALAETLRRHQYQHKAFATLRYCIGCGRALGKQHHSLCWVEEALEKLRGLLGEGKPS